MQCYASAFNTSYDEHFHLTDVLLKSKQYKPILRPVLNSSSIVDVDIVVNLLSIFQIEEAKQILILNMYLDVSWTDEILQWEPTDYGGVDFLFIPQNMVWRPDIIFATSVNPYKKLGNSEIQLRLSSGGRMGWSVGDVVNLYCKIDITAYPFDKQKCFVDITTWSYTKDFVNLRGKYKTAVLEHYQPNGEWLLQSSRITTDEELIAGKRHSVVTMEINLIRLQTFYVLNLILPILLLSFLNPFVFVIPIPSGEQLSVSVTVLLSFTVFLSFLGDSLPRNSDRVSLLSLYLGIMMTLSVLQVILTIHVLRIYNRDKGPVGEKMSSLSRWMLNAKNNITDKVDCSDDEVGWQTVSAAIEKLYFIIFFTLTSTVTIVFFVVGNALNK
ncbi:acetylcholine receptor subunit alpha-like [Haliotis rubra]|uniref:acetylcholine receptor subunit alpha-like n=1 Tax=Haliotis rubra TaxID=36100 RepID=UPI001EE630D0|nr:acetylcholine receptor subunit alpha-like [Haliotis rubra]